MELINDFRNYLLEKNISNPTTLKNYLSDLRHFINWYEKSFGIPFTPEELSEDLIKLYEGTSGASLSAGGVVNHAEKMSHASIKRRLSSLRQFSKFAVENKYIEKNPFTQLSLLTSHLSPQLDLWHIAEFKDYLKFKKASELTVKNYVTDIHSFRRWYESAIEPHVGNISFPVINDSIIEEYKNRLVELKSSAPRTVNRKLSSIRKYVEFAIVSNYINKDFFYTPSGVENLEVSKEQSKTSATLSLNDIEEQKIKINYSPIPPIRLIQRLIVVPYLLTEALVADKIITFLYGSKPLKLTASKVLSPLPNMKVPQKVSDLLKIKGYEKSFYAPNEVSLDTFPFHKKLWHHIRFTRPNWYKKYHSLPVVHYIHFAVLIIFCAGVGIALYRNLVTDQTPLFAAPTQPPRILSFQGRLTDNLDNPITTATDLRFAIYNDLSASGAALLWQEVHYNTNLDQDGIFSVLLGTNTPIPDSVFFENDTIYLGVTIEQTSELAPRRRIASVPYAANSEALQGMEPITSTSNTTNVVLALDSAGDLTIGGTATPTFAATGGQFSLSGKVLLLSTETGTNSDVIISPDGIGKIDVQKPLVNTTTTGNLVPGGVEVNDKFGVLATESAVAAFIVNNNTSGGDIFTASSSGTPRFTIANNGTLTIPVYSTAGGIFYANGAGGLVAQTTAGSGGQCLQSAGGGTPTWGTCGSGGLWRINQGAISPLNDTLDLLVGSNASSSAKFAILNVNDGTPVASISAISPTTALALSSNGSIQTVRNNTLTLGGNTTGNIILSPLNGSGKVGINTSSPLVALDVRGSSGTTAAATVSAKTSFATLTVDNSGVGDLFAASASGVPNFVVRNNGDIVVGQGGAGKVTAAVIDPYLIQNQYTSGNTQLTFQTLAASNGDFIYKNQSTELARLIQAGQFQLPITGSAGGLSIGTDTQLFRGAADRLDLATGDSFNVVSGNYQVGGVTIIDSSSNATFNDITINGTCSGCVSTGNISPFQELAAGAIVPNNSTLDFLIGGQATASAKFAVLNVNSGTPVASVSSGLSGTSAYLTADGTLATQNRQTLTIGNSSTYNTTGNVLINSNGTGNVGIGTTGPTQKLHLSGGVLRIAGGGANGQGEINLDSGTEFDGFQIRKGTTTRWDLKSITAGNDIHIATDNGTDGGVTQLYLKTGGNVGIGDTSPDAKLEVLGTTEQLRLTHTDGTIDTRFTVDASGNLTLNASADGTGSETLTLTGFGTLTGTDFTTVNLSNAALTVASCTGCSDGSGGAFDVLSTGVTVQKNQSTDLLIGASATTSAKFAVTGINLGTNPTASVSATTGGNAGNGIVIAGDGSIQSLRNNTLTLGGNTSGLLVLKSLNNTVFKNPGTANIFVGANAGASNTGTHNSFFGFEAGFSNTSGGFNLFMGDSAGYANTIGSNNMFIGVQAGSANVDGANNLFLGNSSGLFNVSGGNNTFFGESSGRDNTASNNSFFGNLSGQSNTSGTGNVFMGYLSGDTGTGANANTTGNYNTFIGYQSGPGTTTQLTNAAAFGKNALVSSSNSLVLGGTGADAVQVGIGIQSPIAALDIRGGQKGGNAALIVSQTGSVSNDIFTASSSSTTRFTINNAGAIGLTSGYGSSSQCLTSNGSGSAASWGTCGSGAAGVFQELAGAIVPNNSTVDFLIGGQATASARFSVTNLNGPAGSINSWANTTDTGLSGQLEQFGLVYLNGYVYHVAGYDGPTVLDTVRYARVKNDGTLDTWVTSPNTLPEARLWHGTVTVNGYIYVVGGHSSVATPTNPAVYYAKVNADGTVGTWSSTTSIPSPRIRLTHSVAAANGYIYVVGGENSSAQATVWYAKVNADGTLGSWVSGTSLPVATSDQAVVIDNGYIYSMGGLAPSATNAIYYAKINYDGSIGAWIGNPNNLASADYMHSAIAVNGYVYVLGGVNNSTTVYYAKFNSDGTIPSFSTNAASLPESHQGSGITYGNGYIYISGGFGTDNVAYGSIARVSIAGNLDLLGLTSTSIASSSGLAGGGSIFAGNIFAKNLEVGGGGTIWGNLSVSNTLSSSSLSVSGRVSGKALAIFNETGNQDIFSASSSGTTRLTLNNAGQLSLPTQGSTGGLLLGGDTNLYRSAANRLETDDQFYIGTTNAPGNLNLTPKVRIYNEVFTTPAASISAKTTSASLVVTNDGTGDLIAASASGGMTFAVRNNGDILFTGTTIGPGADFAEYYKKSDPNEIFEAGMLVCQSENSGVTKCDGNNPSHILLGAISDNPLITGGGDRENDPNYVLVGLVGQLKVRVAGNIRVGDPLTISGVTGIAVKATNEAVIIGYAMESNNNGTKPRVASSVQKSYYNPNLALNYAGDDSETFIASLNINDVNGKWRLTDAFGNVVNRTSAFSNLVASNIKVGFINAQKITTNAFNASSASISNLTAGVINGTSATIANISSTSLNASNAVLGSVTIGSENVVIAGISLRDYIASVATEIINDQAPIFNGNEIISPIASIDEINTNIISPLADGASIEIEVKPESIAINNTNTGEKVVDIDNEGNARFAGDLEARRATFSGTLSSETLETNNASISGNLATDTLQTNDATISGTLSADRIIANTIDGLDDRISSIASQLVAGSTQQAAGGDTSTNSGSLATNYNLPPTISELEVGNLYADFGIYSQGLSVLGSITTAQLTAMDSIAIGTGFILTDNSINTLGATLEIQPLRQGNISFMAGRVKIDTDGNVDINGNLNLAGIVNANEGVFNGIRTNSLATNIISPLPDSDLVIQLGNNNGASTSGSLKIANANGDEVLKISGEGNIVASGSATFDKLNFNLVGEALADSDLTATATGSAGFATVQRNKPEVTIYNDKITKDSLIYITPFGDTQNKVLHLLRQVPQSETADGSFTVGISGTPATIDIQFNWLIVN